MPTLPRIAVIGAGFSGLGMAAELRRAGMDDFVVLEKADGVGGVWRVNTYPGAACDVPSHLYSFSFAPNPDWSARFSPQPEILAYLEQVATDLDLRRHCRFGVEVASAAFDEHTGTWAVTLDTGEVLDVEVLIAGTGQLARPAIPRLPGVEDFRGTVFHSARWDHDLDFDGERVGVIGTGASAVQFTPTVAEQAAHTTIFQRTPAYVVRKNERRYTALERLAFAKVPGWGKLYRGFLWALSEARYPAFGGVPLAGRIARRLPVGHLEDEVTDPQLRAALEPDEPLGCKRVLQTNDWYPTLVRDDVELVTEGVASFTPDGVVTDGGRHVPLDTVVWGTGFRTSEFLAPMTITGRDGRDLNEAWRDGAEAHLGMTVAGFPNLFLLYGPNTNLGHNSIIYMIESQTPYVRQLIEWQRAEGLAWVDVKSDVQAAFNDSLQQRLDGTVWAGDCSSWYRNEAGRIVNNWSDWTWRYRRLVTTVDRSDFDVVPRRALVAA